MCGTVVRIPDAEASVSPSTDAGSAISILTCAEEGTDLTADMGEFDLSFPPLERTIDNLVAPSFPTRRR